jgi:hypothetical protein
MVRKSGKTQVALIQIDASLIKEVNAYCAAVKKKTGAIKRHVIGSLLQEAIRRDVACVGEH